MKRKEVLIAGAGAIAAAALFVSCSARAQFSPAAGAPPQTQVITETDLSLVKVQHPERFALVTATEREEVPALNTTGVISPDIEKSIPVISLASGRVVGIYAKLGDDVRKGQLLLKIFSNDVSTAYQNYVQAKADETLAAKQLERSRTLYEHGAISLNDLEVAEDAETKARVAVEAAEQQLRNLGGDPDRSSPVVNVYAPASGTIVEQNIVASGDVHTPDNQPNLFTIANLATVWAIADVYENDLAQIRLGDPAEVSLNAYPNRVFHGRIDNISKVLDPATRTAKVRVVLANPGIMRSGMFATVTFHRRSGRICANVPEAAVLHLHDRDWVFVPAGTGEFRRIGVATGQIFGGTENILSGISPGQQVVADALALSAENGE
jgi:cobalt-zinc-cadmium efflux system membrane fusion protein